VKALVAVDNAIATTPVSPKRDCLYIRLSILHPTFIQINNDFLLEWHEMGLIFYELIGSWHFSPQSKWSVVVRRTQFRAFIYANETKNYLLNEKKRKN